MSKKSRVWNYFFKESDTIAICCLCHKNYSRKGRGTTCLRNHLKSKHPDEFITLCEGDMKYMVKAEINDSTPSHSHVRPQETDPIADSTEVYACDENLALMIAQSDHSFNLIEEAGFINFVKVLQPRYRINSTSYYENLLCLDVYMRMQAQLKHQLSMLDSVSLATSIYWGSAGQGLLSLCGFGISTDFQLRKFYLKCEALTEVFAGDINRRIRNLISSASQELQLCEEKIHCVIKDEGTCPEGTLLNCSVNQLKLCVKHALESNEHLEQLDAKCMQIFKHFQQSQLAYTHLTYIHEKRLNRDPCLLFESDLDQLSWNSIFRIKAHLLQLKDALSIYAQEYNMTKIYPDEWLDIDLCNRVVQPIEEIIKIWSDPKTTASSVIPLLAALRDSLRTDVHNFVSSVAICTFARKLLEEVESKSTAINTDLKYLIATYLDPRYKQAFFAQQEAQLVTDTILSQLCSAQLQEWQSPIKIVKVTSSSSNESKIDSFLDNMLTLSNNSSSATTSLHSQTQLKNLLYLYNSEPRIERQSNPITWWQSNLKFSALFPLVRQYLATPAASVDSERLFNISKNLYSDMKSGLCPDNVSKILFIKANYESMHEITL